uniref:WRKY domain-containing protein n=1 Tax=Solanum lycopersicum TaxID=4081 RepID=K4C0R3_SOLLC
MRDDNRDIGVVARSFNINKPNNVIAPKLGLNASHFWNYFDRPLAPCMNSFTGSSEIVSLDLPITLQERSYDQVIITNQNSNQQLYLHSITPFQFIQQITVPQSRTTVECAPPTTTQSQEELTNDKWAWRKYGQKYIKGFTFPRNYYKCSTSKQCEAKKQIEKSSKDENIFLVSCSGEHNHDPPMSRRYLVSCNNNSKLKLPKGINISPKESIFNASSSSSKRVKHSTDVASPIIGTKPPLEIGSKKNGCCGLA